MYRFQPTLISSLPNDLGYSQPRESYLTSLAELRSAKAAEREEEDLIRRLEEIQLQKQYAHRRSQGYRRSLLEDQELERAAAIRHHQQELELEYLRRTRDQEAQILALKRKEEEAKLLQLTRLREEEEARLRVLRRQSQQVEAARQAKVLKEKKPSLCYREDSSDLTTFLNQLLQTRQIKAEPKVVPACRPVPNVNSEAQTLDQLFTDLIKQLHQPAEPRQKPAKEELKKQAPAPPAPTVKPAPVRESLASPQSLEDVLRLIFNPHETELASSSKPVTQAKPKAAEIEKPQQVPVPEPRPASSLSLKEQLEARLNNDQSVEIKDTIQALLASLSDSPAQPSPAPAPASSSKGKGKAPEPQATSTSNDAHKALESVRNIEASFIALQDEFDFPSDVDFSPAPSRSSSPARDDSGHASETDTSTIRKLAYTARNHPIRSYEQSLTRLLSQLDDIESNGNADVRVSRKAIVALVEGALEDLEKKVEARWNKWHKSQVRVDRDEEEVKANNDEAVEATEQPTVATDATVEPDVPASETVADVSSNPVTSETEITEDAPVDIDISTSLDYRSSPVAATEVSSYAEVEPEPTVTEGSDSTQVEHLEEIISSQEAVIDIEASATQPEDDSKSTEPSSYPPTSSDAPTSSYPPVSSGASSVATIRDSDQRPVPIYNSGEEEEEQGQEESDAELSDTFLLPATDSNDFTSTSKRTEQDSEDMGSDWSEVEA